VDARQALLDARVADAAEAWLNDPADVGAYGRLVAAVEERRSALERGDRAISGQEHPDSREEHPDSRQDHADRGSWYLDAPAEVADVADVADVANEAADAEPDDINSWPAVRAVGADLVGDPAAVLRRLRGG
jgi:hypothetical protein